MAFDINFGALQQANPFAAYAQGQEFAQQRRKDQARREAGNIFATDPDRAAQILMGAGDYQSGVALRKLGREDRQERARTQAVEQYAGGDSAGARQSAIAAGDFDLATAIGKMDDQHREQARQNAEDLAAVGQGVAQMPYEQRKAAIAQMRPGLLSRGLSEQAIDAFDPTDENIAAFTNQALGLKGMLEQQDRQADNRRADAQLDETRRHNRAGETTAQGNLAQRRTEHSERKAQGGYSAPRILGSTLPEGY